MTAKLPLLAADLTFARVNGGHTYSALVDWDLEGRAPMLGEQVLTADGSSEPVAAIIDALEEDGTIVLTIRSYGRATT